MSMISAQIDGLRERAKELRNLAPDPDVPYLVPSTKETMALAMRSAAIEMEGAADTIWQLRDDLQRANDENAKLREQMERLVTLLRVDCDIDASWDGLRRFWSIGLTENGCLMRDRACKAEAENANLREQAARAWRLFTENGAVHPSDLSEVDAVRDGLRELGVEVDDA